LKARYSQKSAKTRPRSPAPTSLAEHNIMKAFASESPNGPSITNYDPEKVEVCIPLDWSITTIINLGTLESTSSDNITRTAESMELITTYLRLKARVLQAKQDLLPDLAQELESDAEQLHNRILAQVKGALLFL